MSVNTPTRPFDTDAIATEAIPQATAVVRAGRMSGLRAAIRTRRAQRSELSRQVTAYPAARGVGVIVLPSGRQVAGTTNRL